MPQELKETLGMWWAKILIPILFAIISAIVSYFYYHEIRTDEIEQNLAIVELTLENNKMETREYLDILREMVEGIEANRVAIIAMEAKNNAVIERNNRMIDALIEQAKHPKDQNLGAQ